jgi:iron complex transport system permease protein
MLLLLGAVLLGVGYGAVSIGPPQVVGILLGHLGFDAGIGYSAQQDAVLWAIRMPRVVLGCLVGAALGISGAALQGIFRNPLAEPALVGVAGGGSLGAVAAIVLGFSFMGQWSLPAAAFAGAFVATLAVYAIARTDGHTSIETLILMGIAINAITSAATGYLTFKADDAQLRSIVFWSLGSLGGATWEVVRLAAPFILPATLLTLRWSQALNLLVLGESEARHLGVNTERVRVTLIGLTALMTGAAVAMAGIIGFVGLVVPHLIRLVAGPDHRTLLPASALGGAALLVLADLAARTLVVPAELPLGVVTTLLGGPFFLWLLYRSKQRRMGW